MIFAGANAHRIRPLPLGTRTVVVVVLRRMEAMQMRTSTIR